MAQQVQRIWVSRDGAEDTLPTTITKDFPPADIHTAGVALALGDLNAPTAGWVTPDTDQATANAAGQRLGVLNQRIVTMLVDETVPSGSYYLWIRLIDGTQTILRIAGQIIVS